jgi:hypothetical protein
MLNSILRIVSPTLQTLAIRFDRPSIYPLDLPVLEELTNFSTLVDRVYSHMESAGPIKPLPHLKRIHYAGMFGQYDVSIFNTACEVTPNPTHFRYFGMKSNYDFAGNLEAVMGPPLSLLSWCSQP